ncbi:hypothetical protein [Thalassotalea sp. PS06]|uniref:hypothetical protein n=1 Tax=Thalassotalea sp. PS06 TaxID=2594005 RepID=UPI0011645507|nr:hypothetical protein [Thalassotalea sp. PS06]QDP01928.1 hypothetical protein FNC98_11610 [Thalassotalea sp. PS06]
MAKLITTNIRPIALLIVTALVSTGSYAQEEAEANESTDDVVEQTPTTSSNTSVTTTPTSSGFITLETTIVGNKEQPKVLSIVPWQNPEQAGTLSTEITSQIEQVFRPLDAETLNREIVYFKQSQQ